jgi:hypothetical protein
LFSAAFLKRVIVVSKIGFWFSFLFFFVVYCFSPFSLIALLVNFSVFSDFVIVIFFFDFLVHDTHYYYSIHFSCVSSRRNPIFSLFEKENLKQQ